MTRRIGLGLLVAGACGACWIAPLLVATLGAGWVGALGAGWPWTLGAAALGAIAVVAVRRLQRRRRPGACAAPRA